MLTIKVQEDDTNIDFTYATKFNGSINEFKNIVRVLANALTFEQKTIDTILKDLD